MSSVSPAVPPNQSRESSEDARPDYLAVGAIFALLIVAGPLFLCMPLPNDAALYDVQAFQLLRGGVLYRDLVETNLPGIVLLHAAIRLVGGPSSVALRVADLAFFIINLLLLRALMKAGGAPRAVLGWTVPVLLLFYFSINESCHCQREFWLLLPGLGALTLRSFQIERFCREHVQMKQAAMWASVEGLCWGAGVWIKPMIVVPALGCWAVSVWRIRRWRYMYVDLIGLLAGGSFIGSVGTAWLLESGAWPYFLETLFVWDPHYFASRYDYWTPRAILMMVGRFFPWQFVHCAAVPLVGGVIVKTLARRKPGQINSTGSLETSSSEIPISESPLKTGRSATPMAISQPRAAGSNARLLLAAFYLGWLTQAYTLQHLHDYVHAPGVLLAVGVIGSLAVSNRVWKFGSLAFLTLCLISSPVLQLERLACWSTCVTSGSTADVRGRLAMLASPSWRDLDRVAAHLRTLHLRDGELTCYDNNAIHLYTALGLRPSTRFGYVAVYLDVFPHQRNAIMKALAGSPQRYIVSDLSACGVSPDTIRRFCPEGVVREPPQIPRRLEGVFPWSQPITFRAGPFLVHRVERPLGRPVP